MSDGVGATYGPKPLAFLSANSDELLLSGNRGTFRLPRASFLKLGRGYAGQRLKLFALRVAGIAF